MTAKPPTNNFPNVHLSIHSRNVHVDSILGVPTVVPSTQHGTPTSVPVVPSTQHGTPTSVPSRLVRRRQRVAQSTALVTQQQPLRPCRKQHVNTNSQSIQYRRCLPTRPRVAFGIITLPRQRPQGPQHHAYRAQNTIIDSHKVAKEAHEQHQYAAIDSGASGHFYPDNYKGERHDSTVPTIRVGCANKGVMESLAADIIYFDKLPLEAKRCHKFREIWLPLLSVPQLCKANLTVTFKGDTVEVSDSDGNILERGIIFGELRNGTTVVKTVVESSGAPEPENTSNEGESDNDNIREDNATLEVMQ